tara:strand:- start:388 stop:507 length:120 start_codon:yes stop_codon:yes gene_type:complete
MSGLARHGNESSTNAVAAIVDMHIASTAVVDALPAHADG